MTSNYTTIEISKEYLNFSAAHFTIFDESNRENLHGHNFRLAATVVSEVGSDGLTFDYNILKKVLKDICDQLDERVLIPENSPFISMDQDEKYKYVIFARERIPFLERDILLLPVRNITVEELSGYLLEQLLSDETISTLPIKSAIIKCSSGDGQWASSNWTDGETQ